MKYIMKHIPQSSKDLIGDILGLTAIFVILFIGLHITGL